MRATCRRVAFVCFVLIALSASPASGKFLPEGLTLHQFIQHENAVRLASAPAPTKLLNFYQIEARYRYSSTVDFTAIGRLAYDAIHDLQDLDKTNPFQDRFAQSTPRNISGVNPLDVDFKELYGDFFFERVDVRAGKQIARWGVIEGFRITDELNPIDFNEFILRELTDRYVPLWMLKVDAYFDKVTVQGIWIPELRFHRPAPAGSEFEQFQYPPGLERPARTFLNTEIGLRLSTRIKDFDLAVSFFDGWDDFPTASQTIFGLGQGTSSGQVANPATRYHRIKTFGFTWTKGLGADLIKGEIAYVRGRAFGTFASGGAPTEVERPQFKYGMGWDTRLPFGIETFFQFSQQWIKNHEKIIIADEWDSGASLTLRKKLMNDSLLLKLLVIYLVNDKEALIRPRVTYRWSDYLTQSFGADIFEGREGNIQQDDFRFIGFFDRNDRIYTEIRYSF
ncbi:MAG: DUF1302 family protein [Nitrospiria bacterium]